VIGESRHGWIVEEVGFGNRLMRSWSFDRRSLVAVAGGQVTGPGSGIGMSLRASGSSGQWRPDGSSGQTSVQNSWLGKVSRPVDERYVTGRLLLSPCRLANLAIAHKNDEALAKVK
jgi:hypothetical protein